MSLRAAVKSSNPRASAQRRSSIPMRRTWIAPGRDEASRASTVVADRKACATMSAPQPGGVLIILALSCVLVMREATARPQPTHAETCDANAMRVVHVFVRGCGSLHRAMAEAQHEYPAVALTKRRLR